MVDTIIQDSADNDLMLDDCTGFEIPGLSYSASEGHVDVAQPPVQVFSFSMDTSGPAFYPALTASATPAILSASRPQTDATSNQQNTNTPLSTTDTSESGDAFLSRLEVEISESG